ncbi:hypothetical protein AWW66_20985 [Micromonospora rosaria]|uniref:Uncharacterized protein n=1 Tax=Micromonospora rosaria TaxID=47874 RepID=A0A136PNN8_9ACTN|nr:hypothetical protein AWW66_20985 [Micromonospora rosaria]
MVTWRGVWMMRSVPVVAWSRWPVRRSCRVTARIASLSLLVIRRGLIRRRSTLLRISWPVNVVLTMFLVPLR